MRNGERLEVGVGEEVVDGDRALGRGALEERVVVVPRPQLVDREPEARRPATRRPVCFHSANGSAVARSTSSSVANSRASSSSPVASARAKWSRAPSSLRGLVAQAGRARGCGRRPRDRSASTPPTRRVARRRRRWCAGSRRSRCRRRGWPSIVAPEVVERRLDAWSRARRWRGGGRRAPGGARSASWSRSSWRRSSGSASATPRAGRCVPRSPRRSARRRRGMRGGRARQRCGARPPRATTGCSTPTTTRPARARADGAALRGRRRARTGSHGRDRRSDGHRAELYEGSAAAMTARAWRARGSSTIWPSNAIAASPRATASSYAARRRRGPVELLGRRRERPVGQRDLRRMDAELAPVSEGAARRRRRRGSGPRRRAG